ncbi:MAG: hypothetical protein JPMHGGIA_02029 [Saprospiraceae bacterium]|nr:hypothetical protein [Saprospiraceae bacterium]
MRTLPGIGSVSFVVVDKETDVDSGNGTSADDGWRCTPHIPNLKSFAGLGGNKRPVDVVVAGRRTYPLMRRN